jgi:glycerate 2-kinase
VAHVLICPDKFKGSATAQAVAEAVAAGIRDVGTHTTELLPLADGGDGTLAVLMAAAGAQVRQAVVTGPDGKPVTAEWGLLSNGTAIVEMAQASGLALLGGQLRPLDATTAGTGELIRLAADVGATRCIVAVGGSATTDGGLGALDTLAWSLHGLEVVVACDVTTTFVDAASVFGPQKGANPDQVVVLTQRLEHLADRYLHELSVDVRTIPGSGAAGGLAGGLVALGATIVPGFAFIAAELGLDAALDRASVVITGEGRFDHTSFLGKPVGGVIERCRARNMPVSVVCGVADLDDPQVQAARVAGVRIEQVVNRAPDLASAISDPLPLLRRIGTLLAQAI